ncbi:hypothetical protein EJB05_44725, partial [Eragrostis curvula]
MGLVDFLSFDAKLRASALWVLVLLGNSLIGALRMGLLGAPISLLLQVCKFEKNAIACKDGIGNLYKVVMNDGPGNSV